MKDLYNNRAICYIDNLWLSIINCMVWLHHFIYNHCRFLAQRQLIFGMLYGKIKCNSGRTVRNMEEKRYLVRSLYYLIEQNIPSRFHYVLVVCRMQKKCVFKSRCRDNSYYIVVNEVYEQYVMNKHS